MPKSKRAISLLERQRVGAELRRLRRALDLSQWSLADQAGCSQTAIVQVEHGQPVAPVLIRRIAAALLRLDQEAKGGLK